MKNFLKLAVVATLLSLGGCSFVDVDVRSSETAYKYKKDVNDSDRYNPGSDYFVKLVGEVDPRIMYVDYGVQSLPFKAKYTLPTEQKMTIDVSATIMFRLMRNPKDTNNSLPYSEDEHVQYFAESVLPTGDGRDYAIKVDPLSLWSKLMAEPTDLAFRRIFTDAEKYPSFDEVESNIVQIQSEVKNELAGKSIAHYIEIVGIKIEDIPVPESIAESRDKNLELVQQEINQIQELEILARQAAGKMAVDVRYAMNDVIIDNIVASQIDKGYMFMETLRKGVEKGNAMTINVTPDFMRYLDQSGDTSSSIDEESAKLFNKLNGMSSDELIDFFNTDDPNKKDKK